jgi:hypothetical protein
MRIGEIGQALPDPAAPAGEPAIAAGASRALVALAPAAPTRAIPAGTRQAPFLAHLLAVKDRHAQTRERRRADPQEAIAAYRATVALNKSL